MLKLYIANKNYSSWSLRPWVLMQELGIDFEEILIPFSAGSSWEEFRKFSPSGTVPVLVDGETHIWDSFAIIEYLAENYAGVWPENKQARAWARCASAEMHSGFFALRNQCSMTVGQRVELRQVTPELKKDIQRIDELWSEGLNRFGNQFLASEHFTAVDAFYAPVAYRIRSFLLKLSNTSMEYADRLIHLSSMKKWEDAALKEIWREQSHEEEIKTAGKILQDFRIT